MIVQALNNTYDLSTQEGRDALYSLIAVNQDQNMINNQSMIALQLANRLIQATSRQEGTAPPVKRPSHRTRS